MVDGKSNVLAIDVAGQEYEIRQSLGLLTSSNAEGTTGAALWKITPLVVNWLADQTNVLWSNGILHSQAVVLELGCGISGLLGYALATHVAMCILTDQSSILKLLENNIATNLRKFEPKPVKGKSKSTTSGRSTGKVPNIRTQELNWENVDDGPLLDVLDPSQALDVIVLCDCIYNDFLTGPLVRTCEDLCEKHGKTDTVLLIAQQLRSDDVVSQFLYALSRKFRIWRLSDPYIIPDLRNGSGFAVHLACFKSPSR